MNIISRLAQNRSIYLFLVIVVLLSVSIFINFYGFKITDTDGFYHVRHAWLYRTNGILDTSFPWAQYSVVRTLGGDLWYGFHLLLIPFTFIPDLVWGIKISGASITLASLFLYFLAFYRLKLKFSLLWPAIFPFANYPLISRLAVTRPHPLSFGLNMLLFSFLMRGGARPVFFISFLLSFTHLNLFWVPVLTLVVISIARATNGQSLEKNKITALLSGIAVGAFLRPHPIATFKLGYVQLVEIMVQKMHGVGLQFGLELVPFGLSRLSFYILPLFTATILLFVWFVYKRHLAKTSLDYKMAMWTLTVLTLFFLILTIFVAGRAIEFFIGYLFMFMAFNLTFYFGYNRNDNPASGKYFKNKIIRSGVTIVIAALIIFNSIDTFKKYGQYLNRLFNPYRSRVVSAWLEKNTNQGETVFHLGWDNFPELFFWNRHNYYINGMDPIFLFAYDPGLYWEFHFLSIDKGGEFTCSRRKCTKEESVKTYDVLVNHFKAAYVLIRSSTHPNVFDHLFSSKEKYRLAFFDGDMAIFRIVYPAPKSRKP